MYVTHGPLARFGGLKCSFFPLRLFRGFDVCTADVSMQDILHYAGLSALREGKLDAKVLCGFFFMLAFPLFSSGILLF